MNTGTEMTKPVCTASKLNLIGSVKVLAGLSWMVQRTERNFVFARERQVAEIILNLNLTWLGPFGVKGDDRCWCDPARNLPGRITDSETQRYVKDMSRGSFSTCFIENRITVFAYCLQSVLVLRNFARTNLHREAHPTAWHVIRTRIRSSENYRTKSNTCWWKRKLMTQRHSVSHEVNEPVRLMPCVYF